MRCSTPYSSRKLDRRRPILLQQLADFVRRIAVDHEDELAMAPRGLQQVQAVGLGLAQRLLVPEDNLAVVIFDADPAR